MQPSKNETLAALPKNPYATETPEWQLWELMESAEAQARTFSSDAERLQMRAAEYRAKAARFRAALEKLAR